jgi:hypothetical protein
MFQSVSCWCVLFVVTMMYLELGESTTGTTTSFTLRLSFNRLLLTEYYDDEEVDDIVAGRAASLQYFGGMESR